MVATVKRLIVIMFEFEAQKVMRGRNHKNVIILFTLCSLVMYVLPSNILKWILLAACCLGSRITEPSEELEEEEKSGPQPGVFSLWNAELSCAEPGPRSGLG